MMRFVDPSTIELFLFLAKFFVSAKEGSCSYRHFITNTLLSRNVVAWEADDSIGDKSFLTLLVVQLLRPSKVDKVSGGCVVSLSTEIIKSSRENFKV